MGTLRRKSNDRLKAVKEEADTIILCPRCHGNGMIVINDDGRSYSTRACNWCMTSGGVNRQLYKAWGRLQRIIECWEHNEWEPII
jgi:transcription elongation factor Elf1